MSTPTSIRHLRRPTRSLADAALARIVSTAVAVLVVGAFVNLCGGVCPAEATSPWVLLEELREGMVAAGPTTGRFEQTYIPAGFSSGDVEKGHLSLWLPSCLRWNYTEPETKHFLLCDDEVWFWNDQEPAGRHYRIEPEQEPGLDLLLVDVDRLKERYVAASEKLENGTYRIALSTPEGEASTAGQPFRATITIDPVADRVTALEYTDVEGNLTRFRLDDYQPLQHTALFQAPKDVEWVSE
ncbi:MAG: outer membrane lipoprotein carrier protein LolA [Acidobacteriota bacterium]